jgi:hypothetical protein
MIFKIVKSAPPGAIVLSASQLRTAKHTLRKWGWGKIDGIKFPQKPGQLVGSACHEVGESWLKYGTIPNESQIIEIPRGKRYPGRIIKAGIRHLPPPRTALVEQKFYLLIDGLYIVGYIDFWVPPLSLVGDHKTTTDFQWALTPEELAQDEQGVIYGLASMAWQQNTEAFLKWVYYKTHGPPRTKVVEARITLDEALARMVPIVELGHQLVELRGLLTTAKEIPPCSDHCGDYGGCEFLDHCALTMQERIFGLMVEEKKKVDVVGFIAKKKAKMAEKRAAAGGDATPPPLPAAEGAPPPLPAAEGAPPPLPAAEGAPPPLPVADTSARALPPPPGAQTVPPLPVPPQSKEMAASAAPPLPASTTPPPPLPSEKPVDKLVPPPIPKAPVPGDTEQLASTPEPTDKPVETSPEAPPPLPDAAPPASEGPPSTADMVEMLSRDALKNEAFRRGLIPEVKGCRTRTDSLKTMIKEALALEAATAASGTTAPEPPPLPPEQNVEPPPLPAGAGAQGPPALPDAPEPPPLPGGEMGAVGGLLDVEPEVLFNTLFVGCRPVTADDEVLYLAHLLAPLQDQLSPNMPLKMHPQYGFGKADAQMSASLEEELRNDERYRKLSIVAADSQPDQRGVVSMLETHARLVVRRF